MGKLPAAQKNPPINFQYKAPKGATLHSSGASSSGGKLGMSGGGHSLRVH
jgi:hypothetical protein